MTLFITFQTPLGIKSMCFTNPSSFQVPHWKSVWLSAEAVFDHCPSAYPTLSGWTLISPELKHFPGWICTFPRGSTSSLAVNFSMCPWPLAWGRWIGTAATLASGTSWASAGLLETWHKVTHISYPSWQLWCCSFK